MNNWVIWFLVFSLIMFKKFDKLQASIKNISIQESLDQTEIKSLAVKAEQFELDVVTEYINKK